MSSHYHDSMDRRLTPWAYLQAHPLCSVVVLDREEGDEEHVDDVVLAFSAGDDVVSIDCRYRVRDRRSVPVHVAHEDWTAVLNLSEVRLAINQARAEKAKAARGL